MTCGEIRKAADRAAALTRQLLAFSRKQFLNPTVLDVNETVSGMLPDAAARHRRAHRTTTTPGAATCRACGPTRARWTRCS